MQIWKYACMHCMHVCAYECLKTFKYLSMQVCKYATSIFVWEYSRTHT